MKWKTSNGLNPQCPELRGTANTNQAYSHCPFTVPIRRSIITEHRGFRMEWLWRFRFFILWGIQFQSWVSQLKKLFSPILEFTLNTQLIIIWGAETTGYVQMFRQIEIFWIGTGNHGSDYSKGVTQQNSEERVTTLAKQIWTLCSFFISRFGML